jgi:hypothetical protein
VLFVADPLARLVPPGEHDAIAHSARHVKPGRIRKLVTQPQQQHAPRHRHDARHPRASLVPTGAQDSLEELEQRRDAHL